MNRTVNFENRSTPSVLTYLRFFNISNRISILCSLTIVSPVRKLQSQSELYRQEKEWARHLPVPVINTAVQIVKSRLYRNNLKFTRITALRLYSMPPTISQVAVYIHVCPKCHHFIIISF